MRSLDAAREICEKHYPGLLAALAEIPLAEREAPGSPCVEIFRQYGGGSLLVPPTHGGIGADPLDAVRVQRALGSVSPSLAAAVTMHHFTAATLYSLAERADRMSAAQQRLLERIVPDGVLMASGWAEGKTAQNILNPAVTATAVEGGWEVNGGKKPCSLSSSMDLLTLSVNVPSEDGSDTLAMALVPADSPGVSVHPFWVSPVLAGAQSDEVRLEKVFVPDDMVLRVRADDPRLAADLTEAGFVWFVMLITSVYVGAASALVAQAVDGGRGSVTDRAAMAVRLEAAVALVEGVARTVREGIAGDDSVAQVLMARYACQEALVGAVNMAVELLGGIAFIRSPEVAQLAESVRALAFHPPSRSGTAEALLGYLGGGPLVMA